jgi:hypothetical protein
MAQTVPPLEDRIIFALDRALHEQLAAMAAREHRSKSAQIRFLIERALREDAESRPAAAA